MKRDTRAPTSVLGTLISGNQKGTPSRAPVGESRRKEREAEMRLGCGEHQVSPIETCVDCGSRVGVARRFRRGVGVWLGVHTAATCVELAGSVLRNSLWERNETARMRK